MIPEVMSLEEVAQFLKISERTVLREIKAGRLTAFKAGRSLRFRREAIETYIRNQEVHPDSAEDAA